MPSGKTHQIITEKTTGLVALMAYFSSTTLIEKDWIPTSSFEGFIEKSISSPILGLLATAVVIYGVSLSLKGLAKGKSRKQNVFERLINLLSVIAYLLAIGVFTAGNGMESIMKVEPTIIYGLFIASILGSCYFFAGKMFSGDLDLVSMQSKSWGLFRFIWIPYRKMFSHRSSWTHGIFLGTVFRIIYLATWIFIPLLGLALYLDVSVQPFGEKLLSSFTAFPITYITVFIGLLLGSASHTIADKVVSYWKKNIKNRGGNKNEKN